MNAILFSPLRLLYTVTPILLAALLCASNPAYAASSPVGDAGEQNFSPLIRKEDTRNQDIPWRLNADKLVSLNDGVIVEASGDVLLTRGSDYLKADFARFFTSTNWVYISGNVKVRLGQDEITASEAEFDLTSSTGWLKDGHVFMDGPHIYFEGESVTKHWGDSYTFENAKVTTCDGPSPAWSLTAQSAQVEIDGYATLTRSSFQVKERGLLFAPFMVLPAKTTRQTGLLLPDVGMSSRHGLFYTQPWFWALSQDRDLTFYGTWMEKTGVMPSVEYRSRLSDKEQTWLGLDLLYDDNVFRNDAQDPIDSTDGKVRTNYLRYWLRGMSQGEIAQSQWFYKYNIDYTSDQNFLREFQGRMTGFDNSRDALLDLFGRDLRELDKKRVSEGYIYRDWSRARLAVGARYEQDASLGHGNAGLSTDTTVQVLPQFSAYLFKGRVHKDFPLEVEASANAAYMYRFTGASGLRTEIYPRLSLPLDLKYATMIATAGLRQTFYHNTREEAVSPLNEEGGTSRKTHFGTNRTLPDFKLQLFTQANRVWELAPKPLEASLANVGESRWTGVRHTIQPRLEYSLIPDVDQERNPFYTLDDRITPTNSLYFTLANLVTVRRQTVLPDPVPEGQNAPQSASFSQDYQDLLRIRLGFGYDFEEATRDRNRALYPRRPMMDLMADVNINVNSWLSFWSQAYFSMYGEGVTRSDQGLSLRNKRWGSWDVGYSSRGRKYDYLRQVQYEDVNDINFQDPLSLLTSTLNLQLTPNWKIGLVSNFDLKKGELYENRVSLSYIHQCYRLTGRFTSKGNERSYQFSIELLGLN